MTHTERPFIDPGALPSSAVVAEAHAGERPIYGFVTNVRFISMAAIVALHAELDAPTWRHAPLNVALGQFVKFATVCFFLISGFLLGERMVTDHPWTYFRRRLDALAVPWITWAFVYLGLGLGLDWVARGAAMRSLSYHLAATFVSSAFWFVPNLLFAIAVLLAFRRWLDRAWFGVLLGVVSLAYGVNLHVRLWHDTRHNTALFGFVAYLWMGFQLRRHVVTIKSWVDRASWVLLAALAVVTYAAALYESWLLEARFGGESDLLSTLRVTNVVYSLAAFALLFKVHRHIEPSWMDVRRHTYGIHLTHPVVFAFVGRAFKVACAMYFGVSALEFNAHIDRYLTSPVTKLLAQLVIFVVVYIASWACVAVLAKTRVARYIGVRD